MKLQVCVGVALGPAEADGVQVAVLDWLRGCVLDSPEPVHVMVGRAVVEPVGEELLVGMDVGVCDGVWDCLGVAVGDSVPDRDCEAVVVPRTMLQVGLGLAEFEVSSVLEAVADDDTEGDRVMVRERGLARE